MCMQYIGIPKLYREAFVIIESKVAFQHQLTASEGGRLTLQKHLYVDTLRLNTTLFLH